MSTLPVKPRYSAIPPIEHTNFGLKKYFHDCSYVGNKENLRKEQSIEMRYSGVLLYTFGI